MVYQKSIVNANCFYVLQGKAVQVTRGGGDKRADSNNTLTRSYTWGLDLSQSEQGAVGVGGFLAQEANCLTNYYSYDGNGNVLALIDSQTGGKTNTYTYSPFGKLIDSIERVENPFKFSTKYLQLN